MDCPERGIWSAAQVNLKPQSMPTICDCDEGMGQHLKKLVDTFQRMEAGQQQLLDKVDLQLRQLDVILKSQEKASRQPAVPEAISRLVCQDESDLPCMGPARSMKSKGTHLQHGATQNLLRAETLGGQDSLKRMLDLEAYEGAMGWQKRVEEMFKTDSEADCLTRFASGPVWTFLCLALIIVNTIVIGVETQLATAHAVSGAMSGQSSAASSSDGVDKNVFYWLETAFLVWMIFEVLVNAYAQRRSFFFGKDWQWNAFDVIVILSSVATLFNDSLSVSFLRVKRLFRLGKLLRSFRIIKFLRSVRSMVISIYGSIMHLLSAMLIMCLFMYVVALIIMQGIVADIYSVAAQHDSSTLSSGNMFDLDLERSDAERIYTLYGSIEKTMLTLFSSVSGGLEWFEAAAPLTQLGTAYGAVWTCYIAFMMFGMLNVLTGIFVDTAISAMNNDRENIIQTQIEDRDKLISSISRIFRRSDVDGTGFISEDQMESLLQDKEQRTFLNALGIDGTEARGLFQLLDDDSGTVSIHEFVTGVLRLKGSAKAVDMLTLMYENRKISTKLTKIFQETNSVRKALAIVQHHLRGQQNDRNSPRDHRDPREQVSAKKQLLESIQAFGVNEFRLATILSSNRDELEANCV